MVSFFGCCKSDEQKAKDLSHKFAGNILKQLQTEHLNFLEKRARLGVEATVAVCFDIKATFHKGTLNYELFLRSLLDSLFILSQYGLENHQKEPLQKYVTKHLVIQIRDSILQIPFNKPQFEERSTNVHVPPLSTEAIRKQTELKNTFWNNVDCNDYTKTDVILLTHTFEFLILDTIKKLDPNTMVQNALKDYKAEYLSLISRDTAWRNNADIEAKRRADQMMPR